MARQFLSEENFKNLISKLRIDDDQKSFLLSELPKMDTEDRLGLLDALKDVYILDREEAETIKKIEDNWK